VEEIFTLLDREIFQLAALPHCIWLWTVDRFLLEAESAMAGRGYRLHARIVWDKGNGVAPAFTVRYAHEYLLWFYKPRLLSVAREMRGKLTTVLRAAAREHSRKPDEAYAMIESLYPSADRLDVFSRERRRGWHQYGDQLDFFPCAAVLNGSLA
jgi:N6-adenosine-specific RNA methylase IME4